MLEEIRLLPVLRPRLPPLGSGVAGVDDFRLVVGRTDCGVAVVFVAVRTGGGHERRFLPLANDDERVCPQC